jgi:hypothetical protein
VATLIGTLGGATRALVTEWGAIDPCDGSPRLDWWVAADDRWHHPDREPTRRQHRIAGAPVVETRIAVPGGDVAHRAYVGVAGDADVVVVELENSSPLPVAVAFSRRDISTGHPAAPLPPDSPIDARVAVPLAHRSLVRAVVGSLPRRVLPSAEQVARGWVTQTETGSRYELPDPALGERVVAARSDALLDRPDDGDPIELLLTVRERCQLGEGPVPWVSAVRAAAETVARRARREASWEALAALGGAADVLHWAGEQRGARDVSAIMARLPAASPDPPAEPDGVRLLAWIGRVLVRWPMGADGVIDLVPGYPAAWAGLALAIHGVRSRSTTLGLAVRWHGDRPALLWEIDEAVTLTCRRLDPSWSASAVRGEALLAPFRV